jgi:hypothetical protein
MNPPAASREMHDVMPFGMLARNFGSAHCDSLHSRRGRLPMSKVKENAMNWKRILWHLWRLALAAVLLWIDQRIFLFYAFTVLLVAVYMQEKTYALIRCFQVMNEARMTAIAEALKVSEEETNAAHQRAMGRLTLEQRDQLDADWRLVTQ